MLTKSKKVLNFIKKYGYYIVGGFIITATILTLLFTGAFAKNNPINNPKPGGNVIDVQTPAIVFCMPVDGAVVLKGFSNDSLMYNTTLKQWEAHKGLEIASQDSNNVVSVFDGTITKVYHNFQEGTVVEITHKDGLKTVYGSLDPEEITVEEGDKVSKGQIIGQMSASAERELELGDHLYFEVIKDGEKQDPTDYLELLEK